jgi:predicted Zn-dependent protease
MQWRAWCRVLAVVLIVSLLASCASTKVPPIGAGNEPFKLAADERDLWQLASKEEEKLQKRGKLYDDPMLEEYLSTIGDRLAPPEVKQAEPVRLRFFVFRDPTLNAFALPNGHIYLHTGLISRVENEAQLSTIIAHELTHAAQRHLAEGRRGWSMQWLREGFAEWVAAEVVARLGLEMRDVRFAKARGRVRWVKDAGDLPELKQLVTAGEWNLVQAKPEGAASYDFDFLATDLLIRDAGLPAVVEYFRLAGEPVGATGPFHQAFGVSLKEFEARCDAYLQEILR